MNGYYLWIPKDDIKTDHPLRQKTYVKVFDGKVYVFGSDKSWTINHAQAYGLLGYKLDKLIE